MLSCYFTTGSPATLAKLPACYPAHAPTACRSVSSISPSKVIAPRPGLCPGLGQTVPLIVHGADIGRRVVLAPFALGEDTGQPPIGA